MALSSAAIKLLNAWISSDHYTSDSSTNVVFALTVDLWDIDPGSTTTLYFSDRRYRTAYDDTPANTLFLPRLEVPDIAVTIVSAGSVARQGSQSIGVITLLNSDGELDSYLNLNDYDWEGRAATLYIGADDWTWASFEVIVPQGRIRDLQYDETRIRFHLDKSLADFDKPLQSTLFKQADDTINDSNDAAIDDSSNEDINTTNIPDVLLSSVAGRRKPLVFGHVRHMAPVLVDNNYGSNGRYRYLIHDGEIQRVVRVYEGGLEMTETTDYTVDLDGAYIDLVSIPQQKITCEVKGGKYGTPATWISSRSSVIDRIAQTYIGLASGEIDRTNFRDLDAITTDNVLDQSNELDGASWTTKDLTISEPTTAPAINRPDPPTIYQLQDSATGTHFFVQTVTKNATATVVSQSIYIHQNFGTRNFRLYLQGASTSHYAHSKWDLSDGSLNTSGVAGDFSGLTTSSTVLGNGWYRIKQTVTTDAHTELAVRFQSLDASFNESYTGGGTGGWPLAAWALLEVSTVNLAITDDISAGEVLDYLVSPTGYWLPNFKGDKITFGVLTDPSGESSTASFNTDDISSLERLEIDPPVWRATLNFNRNFELLTNYLGATAPETQAWQSERSETAVSEDATIQTDYAGATEEKFDSPFYVDPSNQDASEQLADDVLSLLGKQYNLFEMSLSRLAASLSIGDVITVTYDRFGLDAGKKLLVVGMRFDTSARLYRYTLWGRLNA